MKTRVCPKCTRTLSYSRDRDCERANRKNSICSICHKKKIPTRVCPRCKKTISYTTLGGFKIATTNNTKCKLCATTPTLKGEKRKFTSLQKQKETYSRNRFFKQQENVELYKSLEMKWDD